MTTAAVQTAHDYSEYASAPHYTTRANTTHITLDDYPCNHHQAFCRACGQMQVLEDAEDTCPQCGDITTPPLPIYNCTCTADRIDSLSTRLAPIIGNGLVRIGNHPLNTARRFLADPYHAITPTGIARQDWYIENDTIIVTTHSYITGHTTTQTIRPLYPNTTDEDLPRLKKIFAID